jgi:hypothetical protein
MNTRVSVSKQPAVSHATAPIRSSLLQRKCACGGTPGPTGECEECRKNRGLRDGDSANSNPNAAKNFAFDFSTVPVFGMSGYDFAKNKDAPTPAPAPGVTPPSPPPPAKAPACDAAKQSPKYTACIQPVLIAQDDGKNPTSAPSFAESTSIWAKCCVTLSVNAAKTCNKTAYQTLDESKDATPTNEEKDLFKDAGSSSCIQVFVPTEFAQDGKTGKDISGGGATYDYGTANPKIVVVEGAVGEVVAHEVGHALGHVDHDTNATVMKPTSHYNVANKSDVSDDVCKKAKTGSVLTKGGADKDCCMSF